jgi:di/tricarboxylate transporter
LKTIKPGGFILARAFSKYKLDQLISERILRVVGRRTNVVMFALMGLSMTLSMWMSNTASDALLLPISTEILLASRVARDDRLWKRFPLAVGYAATLGGLGTVIGSPPNALAQRFLQGGGITLGEAVSASGVDVFIADSLATLITGLPALVLLIVTAFVGLIMTIVASNTGAARCGPETLSGLSTLGRFQLA